MKSAPAIVIGGGWAGLAAAVELAAAGHAVELYEAAPQLGGRARSVALDGQVVDNGQHLLIGAYRDTLALLRRLDLDEHAALVREPLRLVVVREHARLALKAPALPAPLHLAWALLRAHGLSGEERRAALVFCLRIWRQGFRLDTDISVAELLTGQPGSLVRSLWEPLCLATLNTPLHEASAAVFLRVLRDAFARRRHDADLLHPRLDLGQLLPQPAQAFIERRGGKVHVRQRIDALWVEDATVHGVVVQGTQRPASQVILAAAPWHASTLLAAHPGLQSLAAQLRDLGSAPITTLYLRYPPEVRLGQPMLGFSGTQLQWLIDRGLVCGQAGLMAAVISGEGPHLQRSTAELAQQLSDEIAAAFPAWPRPRSWQLIREKRATFRCSVGCDARRPGHATAVRGLWLAGDYTDTGYPATLEGAVRSGVQCARLIIGQHG